MAKTDARIISKPDTASDTSDTASASEVTTVADVVTTPTPVTNTNATSSSNSNITSSVNSSSIDKNREQNKELMNSDKEPIPTKKPNRNIIPPKIGLYNRTNYNLHVVFKNEDVLFPPRKRTEKIYKESDIVSVQGKSLQSAISTGVISIIH